MTSLWLWGLNPAPFLFSTSPSRRSRPPLCLSRPPLLPFPLTLPRPAPAPSPPPLSAFSRYAADESPVGDEDEDDLFLADFVTPESEEAARRRSWTERGWAPWEEILSPEADFARKSLDEGEEVPLTSPEAVEAFRMLTPSYRKKKIKEIGEEEYLRRLFAIKGEIPEKLKTIWAGPLALQLVPPRDWPPQGWEVNKAELEFIREAHKLQSVRVDIEGAGSERMAWSGPDGGFLEKCKQVKEVLDAGFGKYEELWTKFKEWAKENPDRLKMNDSGLARETDFLEQYKKWVGENRDDGLQGEGMGEVELAVKRYEEFLKQLKKKANPNGVKSEKEAKEVLKGMALERYNVFLKQYNEWVDANRDRLEEESYKVMV